MDARGLLAELDQETAHGQCGRTARFSPRPCGRPGAECTSLDPEDSNTARSSQASTNADPLSTYTLAGKRLRAASAGRSAAARRTVVLAETRTGRPSPAREWSSMKAEKVGPCGRWMTGPCRASPVHSFVRAAGLEPAETPGVPRPGWPASASPRSVSQPPRSGVGRVRLRRAAQPRGWPAGSARNLRGRVRPGCSRALERRQAKLQHLRRGGGDAPTPAPARAPARRTRRPGNQRAHRSMVVPRHRRRSSPPNGPVCSTPASSRARLPPLAGTERRVDPRPGISS